MKALLLGGAGFIGARLARRLVADGHEVTVFCRATSTRWRLRDLRDRLSFHVGDFLDESSVRSALKPGTTVFHLAGATLPSTSLSNAAFDFESNLVSTARLVSACADVGVAKLVYISSGGTVYGIPQTDPIPEDHPLLPIVPYGLSKMAIEHLLRIEGFQRNFPHAVLRLSNPYGPDQVAGTGQGVIATWVRQARSGAPLEVWGDGGVVRDFVHVDDAVDAVVRAAAAPDRSGTFNVGSGVGHSLLQVHQALEAAAGRTIAFEMLPGRRADVPRNVLDISRARQVLGWSPSITLEQGLREQWLAADPAVVGIAGNPTT